VTRPPFDPKRARGDSFAGGLFDPTPVRNPVQSSAAAPTPERDATPPASAAPAPAKQNDLTVTQFSEIISRTLEDGMRGAFRVQGEIANISKRGHWYFSLKDAGAVLSCVMWQSDAARATYDPREGDAVVVTGRIKHYAPQGRTQLYVTKVEKQGLGTLEQQFQALVSELRELGYFDESRKKELPAFPRSPAGRALRCRTCSRPRASAARPSSSS
jgi:exodeoxyribonuclease VII large subunit